MSRTLIRGGWVLTMGRTNYTEADVLLDGDTIAEIGSRLRARDADVVDAAGSIIMPGFVDAHRHLGESLHRNTGAEARSVAGGPDDIYASTLVGLLGAAEAGITTVADWCEAAADAGHFEAVLRAHHDSGSRTVLVVAHADGSDSDWDGALRRAASADVGPLTTVAAGVAATRRGELEHVASRVELARELGLQSQLHLESSEGADILAGLSARSLLGDDIVVTHGSYLDEAALDHIAAAGSRVVLAPASEMAAGLGTPPIQELIDRDIRPGLGVGTERLAPGDAFAQMRAAISVQHATRFDLKLAGKAGLPKLMTTRDVIRHATIDGAGSTGLDGIVGSLRPGMQADVLVLRADSPNVFPVNDPIGAVVWGMDTSNVAWVFVGGHAVKQDGRLTADVDRARSLALAAHSRLVVAGGGAAPISGGRG